MCLSGNCRASLHLRNVRNDPSQESPEPGKSEAGEFSEKKRQKFYIHEWQISLAYARKINPYKPSNHGSNKFALGQKFDEKHCENNNDNIFFMFDKYGCQQRRARGLSQIPMLQRLHLCCLQNQFDGNIYQANVSKNLSIFNVTFRTTPFKCKMHIYFSKRKPQMHENFLDVKTLRRRRLNQHWLSEIEPKNKKHEAYVSFTIF